MNHESRLWETLQDKWPLISTNYHTYTQNDEKEYRLKRDLRPIKPSLIAQLVNNLPAMQETPV